MSTPNTPKVVTTVHKAGQGGQVSPTGNTVKPSQQSEQPPKGINAPSKQVSALNKPQNPSALSYK